MLDLNQTTVLGVHKKKEPSEKVIYSVNLVLIV